VVAVGEVPVAARDWCIVLLHLCLTFVPLYLYICTFVSGALRDLVLHLLLFPAGGPFLPSLSVNLC
jgi:predicted Zn-dependent protease